MHSPPPNSHTQHKKKQTRPSVHTSRRALSCKGAYTWADPCVRARDVCDVSRHVLSSLSLRAPPFPFVERDGVGRYFFLFCCLPPILCCSLSLLIIFTVVRQRLSLTCAIPLLFPCFFVLWASRSRAVRVHGCASAPVNEFREMRKTLDRTCEHPFCLISTIAFSVHECHPAPPLGFICEHIRFSHPTRSHISHTHTDVNNTITPPLLKPVLQGHAFVVYEFTLCMFFGICAYKISLMRYVTISYVPPNSP